MQGSPGDVVTRRICERVIDLAHRMPVHVGSALSAAHVLAALYHDFLRVRPDQPDWPGRDRFILSKGHAAYALYAALAEFGFLPDGTDPAELPGHPTDGIPGVDAGTGALGHGLSVGCGIALAGRFTAHDYRVVVLLGDGELNEGSVWESAMFAAHHGLTNLIAIVDRNAMQQEGDTAEILDTEPLVDKWAAFGWSVSAVGGHDRAALSAELRRIRETATAPTVLIASTTKGNGVSFMADNPVWHMGQLDDELYQRALADLRGNI